MAHQLITGFILARPIVLTAENTVGTETSRRGFEVVELVKDPRAAGSLTSSTIVRLSCNAAVVFVRGFQIDLCV